MQDRWTGLITLTPKWLIWIKNQTKTANNRILLHFLATSAHLSRQEICPTEASWHVQVRLQPSCHCWFWTYIRPLNRQPSTTVILFNCTSVSQAGYTYRWKTMVTEISLALITTVSIDTNYRYACCQFDTGTNIFSKTVDSFSAINDDMAIHFHI